MHVCKYACIQVARGWGLTDNVKERTRVGTNRQCSINTQGWGLTDNVTSTHKGAELTG